MIEHDYTVYLWPIGNLHEDEDFQVGITVEHNAKMPAGCESAKAFSISGTRRRLLGNAPSGTWTRKVVLQGEEFDRILRIIYEEIMNDPDRKVHE